MTKDVPQPPPEDFLTNLKVRIDGIDMELIEELTVNEVTMTESLLTPGLQTKISVHSRVNTQKVKNLNDFANRDAVIYAERPIIAALYGSSKRPDGHDYVDRLEVKQRIYRLSNRKLINYQIEQFDLELCDPSLLVDAKTFVTNSWKCATPTKIVTEILKKCIGASSLDIEDNVGPVKDYFAPGIHPFQAITQQEEMALAGGKIDPSLIHFMTYQNDKSEDNTPTHNFRSLTRMARQSTVFNFFYSGKNSTAYNYAIPKEIMTYTFPCDFDTLSDILNGIDINGDNYSSISGINVTTAQISNFTAKPGNTISSTPCGNPPWFHMTNLGSSQNDCATNNSEAYLPIRKARMGLLEQDKIAIRLTVPWNPNLNVGRMIYIEIPNANPDKLTEQDNFNFGTGRYLIVNLTHNIKLGGLGITTIECVSNTVAAGVQ
jgi:hypothetical protein